VEASIPALAIVKVRLILETLTRERLVTEL
jgi:hypothetical protein